MGELAAVIPMAFVMVAGPQIVSAIFLATSRNWLRNSLAYLLGVVAASTVGTGAAYFGTALVSQGATSSKQGPFETAVQWACAALLLFLAARVFLKRRETESPKWMGKLQDANGAFSFKIAFLLYLLMPTDVVSMVTVGAHLGRSGSPYWHVASFIAATVLLAGTPMILDLLLGKRAEALLPRIRDWMNRNAWIVSEVLILFFLAMTVKGILAA